MSRTERTVLLGGSAFTSTLDHRRWFMDYDQNSRAILDVAMKQIRYFRLWKECDSRDLFKRGLRNSVEWRNAPSD